MDLKSCRICDAPGTYEDGGQSIDEHIALGNTDPWCECECCGNTERYHDWQDSEPLDSPLRRQLAAANAKLAEATRLAQDTREQVGKLTVDLDMAVRMEKALRFYADHDNWCCALGPDGEPMTSDVDMDFGANAREALAAPTGEKEG